MKRIKSYFFTILAAAAFIYGSWLCTLHGNCLHDPSQGSLELFGTGLALILSGLIVINLLIKSSHPEITFRHRLVSSAGAPLLLFMGTNIVAVKPLMHVNSVFSADNLAFYFGVYLLVFGVAFLHFLLKE